MGWRFDAKWCGPGCRWKHTWVELEAHAKPVRRRRWRQDTSLECHSQNAQPVCQWDNTSLECELENTESVRQRDDACVERKLEDAKPVCVSADADLERELPDAKPICGRRLREQSDTQSVCIYSEHRRKRRANAKPLFGSDSEPVCS